MIVILFLGLVEIRHPPRSTRTATVLPYTTHVRAKPGIWNRESGIVTGRFRNLARSAGVLLAGALVSFGALAAEGGALRHAGVDIGDQASLQRGAKLYMNYCSGCHSLKYLRYSRMAEDLGLSEEDVMDNLNFTGAKFGEQIGVAMTQEHGTQWF